jgi:hypothetical protein
MGVLIEMAQTFKGALSRQSEIVLFVPSCKFQFTFSVKWNAIFVKKEKGQFSVRYTITSKTGRFFNKYFIIIIIIIKPEGRGFDSR